METTALIISLAALVVSLSMLVARKRGESVVEGPREGGGTKMTMEPAHGTEPRDAMQAAPVDESVTRRIGYPLSYGDSAVLRPEPRRVAEQPWQLPEQVHDTAIDWLEAENLSARAVSVRGHGHRHGGEIRQDSLALGAVGDFVTIAVADGVGSADQSHVGSMTAARAAARWDAVPSLMAHLVPGEPVDFSWLAREVNRAALDRNLHPKQVSTTLALMAVPRSAELDAAGDPWWVVGCWQVGDSAFAVLRDGEWQPIGFEESETGGGLTTTVVQPLPLHQLARSFSVRCRPGDTIVAASDGVLNPLTTNSGYAAALAACWTAKAPTPAELLHVVDATLRSFDDDRTLAGVRFGPAHV